MSRARWFCRLLVGSALLWSCAHARTERPLTAADYPGVLTPPESHPGQFIRRQTISARFHDRVQSFEAVLQKKDNQLTLIGLTPFGAKALVLQQTGTRVTFTPIIKREMPFPPEFMLNDIQRTYFDSISDEPLPDGWHALERGGELIRERWQAGRLMERHFMREKSDPPGEIAITYVGGMKGPESPAVIELDNGWFGYHLTIRTVSEQAL